jgi:hypothetical protein
MMGVTVPEVAFGWQRLALTEKKRKSELGSQKP